MLRGKLSRQSDVYAFGVLLWELYSGGHAFKVRTGWKGTHACRTQDRVVAQASRVMRAENVQRQGACDVAKHGVPSRCRHPPHTHTCVVIAMLAFVMCSNTHHHHLDVAVCACVCVCLYVHRAFPVPCWVTRWHTSSGGRSSRTTAPSTSSCWHAGEGCCFAAKGHELFEI
jgi:hypothetical protein